MAKGTGDQGGDRRGRALTPQREAVLRVVNDSGEHLTANEIYEAARRLLPSISFATVYNSLKYLREAGLLREINFGKSSSRYDRETARHDHAICSRCGKLVDFDLEETPQLMRAAARRSRFKPESIQLTLVGVCPGCQEGG
ncbi:MAG TPA: transcriptional repressor [Pyrinomonadaceae bacterium]|nr:transcriptional repressor [Pyrinomonadaceae bacterium]